jgi:hypothetical protein
MATIEQEQIRALPGGGRVTVTFAPRNGSP